MADDKQKKVSDPSLDATQTKNPTWTINDYHAAACIKTSEINRKMKDIYNSTDDFPHSWQAQEATAPGHGPKWKVEASQIDAPSVSFASDLKNGVNLSTTVKKGDFKHLKVVVKGLDENDKPIVDASWESVNLTGVVFSLQTNMKNVEHVAAKGDTVDTDFTVQQLYAYLDNPKILTELDTSKAISYKAADDTGRSVRNVLLDMCKSDNYKNNYVFGVSKVPNVDRTHGLFTPRAVRFSTFQNVKDKTIGSLNWNLIVSGDDKTQVKLPDLNKQQTAGTFDEMPIPSDVPGVMLVSFGKLIMELIVPKAFEGYGLDSSKWSADEANGKAVLNVDVGLSTGKIKSATFTANNNKIYPDPKYNRIRVDFSLEHIDAGIQAFIPINFGSIIAAIKHPKYKATWSGYFTFTLEGDELKTNYTQDVPDLHVQDDNGAWRYIADISALGFSELQRKIESDIADAAVKKYVSVNGQSILPNVKSSVELPGGAVFEFDKIDWVYLGLRAHLKYAPYTVYAGSEADTMKTVETGAAVNVNFVNASSGKVSLYWVDMNGAHQSYTTIDAGKNHVQPTYVGHVWVVKDVKEKAIAIYRIEGIGTGSQIKIIIQ